ncbi:YbaK/EbsC family protein [Roseisalinus antarcticus]|uniref:Cys-tRNA(Pro)/Cys-tRNA(Cys) deacylase YbaK n=1 Tax=Roseisalinus antarcticus TaxID=254357 RepID=A0A1Y5RJE0_9RHOB|nr:YbaK/EbsC family protein [Roseisalinus antarcticus]SLN18983.1 Cys-tRNA(Pro)/Cys-tRNA(Cys) deacylase YbaK [Roseisalinus antarcticus]
MSKSLQRVSEALRDSGLKPYILEMGTESRTAQQAADAAGCALDQIAKSIVFQGALSGEIVLFLTAGGNRVDADRAASLAGEPLTRADPKVVRERTGFAIGGVAPIGHLSPVRAYWDPRLSEFSVIYAAAGTPRHVFPITPADLMRLTDAREGPFTA